MPLFRTLTLLGAGLLAAASAWAQPAARPSARAEIAANPYLSASNYLNYDNAYGRDPLSPAPEGYEPFYLTHYGRHGSRWLLSYDEYTRPLDALRRAARLGKLTATGDSVLRVLEAFFPKTRDRLGDLTRIGELQHQGIGRRMTERFPEIFLREGVEIDARSTVVQRCILSMTAECLQMAAANPSARIHNDVSEALQPYLNQNWRGLVRQQGGRGWDVRNAYKQRLTRPARLMGLLFNDTAYVSDSVDAGSLMRRLFDVAANMQSHFDGQAVHVARYSNGAEGSQVFAPGVLLRLFTPDELYDQWRIRNVDWYLGYGPAPHTGGVMPWSQRNLLDNIIATADTVSRPQATLRFGHEVCVMPLACLLELGACGTQVADLDTLDRVWRNYDIYPMAGNVQLIFYRPRGSQSGADAPDVLVKALLNEREVSLPAQPVAYPYYRWSDLRAYYLDKIRDFDRRDSLTTAAP